VRRTAELQTSPVVAHLPFADHVHDFDAAQNDARAAEVLEALYRACDALDRAMVVLDNAVTVVPEWNGSFWRCRRPSFEDFSFAVYLRR
jgi:hypothetical protein